MVSRRHNRRPLTPDTDDAVSLAESSPASMKVRRTEAERIELFKDYPECGEMEPHRVFCMRCDKWVNLGKQQTYTVKPWEKHRIRCDQMHPEETSYVVPLLSGLTVSHKRAYFVVDAIAS
jgi:hypothetical protein